ncbi:anthranilate phosphoribosyltransferase [Sporocytophaga myxococcoides]|uniref:Anthranilate phosphoribosyltransferase n=1 Tax=Sporocytophaga myxococcoides TaxID=153721 RepID=A0A098LDN0_9BACT|nr:anthranilate phosphoribosyltransferase [Sporocytophaga myxococcoides]GAL84557.1 anthranilate phosphoribosyltransferase [Sporocytophaga myxococcoides]
MKEIILQLLEQKSLSKDTAKQALTDITLGRVNHSQMACFMTVYMMRSITVEELEGFRDAMLELCLATDLSEYNPIDLCGTGGDGKDTFNVSTLASFVVAGAGVKVAKHGNYGVSSGVGSSNIMEHFGYKFTNEISTLRNQIEKTGICILHAPLFHPSMKNVGPIRKDLGVKTFFNMLGPMSNPAFPQNQLVGVFSLELARLYGYLYQKTGKNFTILHSLDGYDEISLTGAFKIISNKRETILRPEDIGFSRVKAEALTSGKSLESSAKIFTNVLCNEATQEQTSAVIVNAAMAIWCTRPELSLEDAIGLAKESLESGKALSAFKTLLSLN